MQTFIVVITNKLNIGLTITPYYAEIEEDKPINLIEQATINHLNNPNYNLNDDEKEIITILNRISDNFLFKKFSRNKNETLKVFFDNLLSDDRYEKSIYPHIQNVLYQTITAISKTTTPVFYKENLYTQIYLSEKLKIESKPTIPHFNFTLEENVLEYRLEIIQETDDKSKTLHIANTTPIVVTNNPASFIVKNNLIFFDNIEDKKLMPFFKTDKLIIKSQHIEQYMKVFVKNTIEQFDNIHHSGFEINYIVGVPLATIKIEQDLSQNSILQLYFTYNKQTFLADKGPKIIIDFKIENGKYYFTKYNRNRERETEYFNFLKDNGLQQIEESQFRPENVNQSNSSDYIKSIIAEWLSSNVEKLTEAGFNFTQANNKEKIFIGSYKIKSEIIENNDWFELKASVLIGKFVIPFYKFKKHILENNPKFTLPNDEIFLIPQTWYSKYEELFTFAKTTNQKIELPRSHFQMLEDTFEDEKIGINKHSEIEFSEIDVPKSINATLRPYQKEGFNWLNFLYKNRLGGILADDMGLGKTLQTITMLAHTYNEREDISQNTKQQTSLFDFEPQFGFNKSGKSVSIIIMPTSLIYNWEREIKRFAPHLKTYKYTGSNRLKSKDIGNIIQHYHVVLTTYGIVRNDIDYLNSYKFHYAILDESQYVKNPSSKIYDAISQIKANHKVLLTGTPIENSLVDLWAQMNFVNPGLLGTLSFFKKYFEIPITRKKSETVEEKLQKLILPYFLRRTKDSVARDLPPRVDQTIYCEMTEAQKKYYDTEKAKIRNELLEVFESTTPNNNAIKTLEALSKLRQISNHPAMIDENYQADSGKFEQILDSLEYILSENHNVLIFSSYVKDLKLIEKELIKRKHPYSMLIGETRDREKVIDEFNREKRVFLSTIKAGGVGLNLTKADYVFILNPWWNPASEEQAINRAHRIGQEAKVFVYKFISVDTIEEKIAKLQEKKLALASKFITENEILKNLTKEEILQLFG